MVPIGDPSEGVAPAAIAGPGRSVLRRRWQAFLRNRGALVAGTCLILITLFTAAGPMLSGQDPDATNLAEALKGPTWQHLLGTDELGRDVLTRLMFGARVSLAVGLMAAFIATTVGTLIGTIAGFFGGWPDAVAMRFTDSLMSLPTFFLALTVIAVFGGGFTVLVLVIALTSWMGVARVVRGECLRWKTREFVTAAQAIGASDVRVMLVHVLPQAVSSIVVAGTLAIARAIIVESALSYLGLGIQPPMPSWGNMLLNAQRYVWTAPMLAVYPGLLISLTVLAFNFFGDGLRDALSPFTMRR